MGIYKNHTNAADGYVMAYYAGAELAHLDCYQINPLIKDDNGPACAYVAGPLGGLHRQQWGGRFIECDYCQRAVGPAECVARPCLAGA